MNIIRDRNPAWTADDRYATHLQWTLILALFLFLFHITPTSPMQRVQQLIVEEKELDRLRRRRRNFHVLRGSLIRWSRGRAAQLPNPIHAPSSRFF